MKVKYIGDYYKVDLIKGNIYEVTCLSPHIKFFRLKDETGEEFDFPPDQFEIVEGDIEDTQSNE